MAFDVTIYQIANHPRSTAVTTAMLQGIKAVGDRVQLINQNRYRGLDSRVVVFYGLAGSLARVLQEYSADPRRTCIYIDMGYWGRKDGGRFAGYHKLSVDGRHPTPYFQARRHDGSRAAAFDLRPMPWRKPGGPIVIAGMGPKGARAERYNPTAWERDAIAQIKKHTDRRIIYRPKPNWEGAAPIPGTEFAPGKGDLLDVIRGAHAVVSHHSNACVEGLQAGIPSFVWGGVAEPLSLQDLSQIESPLLPDSRQQWLNDIAWCQWSVAEMAEGLPWRHLKDEGLIP